VFKHIWLIVIICAAAVAAIAQPASAGNSNKMPVAASFIKPPACVVAGHNAEFPLKVTNYGDSRQLVTVQLAYVTPFAQADPYSVVITDGTDHLLGVKGGEFWRFWLAPGKSVVKHLVTRIQPQYETKRGPATYAVNEFVSVAGFDGASLQYTATAGYCA